MGNKKYIILTTFSFLTSLVILIGGGNACHLESGSWYKDSNCTQAVSAYYFAWDLGGCVMGYSAGQLYSLMDLTCGYPEEKWNTSGSYDGQICKAKWGWNCKYDEKEGVYDYSEGKCVNYCYKGTEHKYFDCSEEYIGDKECESACGASPECDEFYPYYLSDICGETTLEVNRDCYPECKYSSTKYTCNATYCGNSQSCGGSTYYCVYDAGWKWSTSKPTNFCCSDADCPACANNVNPKCDTTTYTCKCYPCETNANCIPGYCCLRAISSELPKECVPKGNVTNYGGKSYLCDPPGWPGKENTSILNNVSIIGIVWNFLVGLFMG